MSKNGKDYSKPNVDTKSAGKDNAGQGASGYKMGSLYDGLDRNLPRPPGNAGMPSASVNATSTRGSETAPTPKTLGPRTA